MKKLFSRLLNSKTDHDPSTHRHSYRN